MKDSFLLYTYLIEIFGYNFSTSGLNLFLKNSGGLVKIWYIRGDTSGDDIGESYVTANFSPINIVLKETGDCITEAELAALMNTNKISTTTINKLRAADKIIGSKMILKDGLFKMNPTP